MWTIDLPEDVFLDADESEGWIPVLDVDFDRETIEGRVVLYSSVHVHGENDWRIRVPKCSGEDLARFLENNVVHRILRMTEEDLSEAIVSNLYGSIRLFFTPSEAIDDLCQGESWSSILRRILSNGMSQFWEHGSFQIVPSRDRLYRHLTLERQKEEAILEFVDRCFESEPSILSVSSIPEDEVEVLQMLGEPFLGFNLEIDPDIDPLDLQDLVSRMNIFGPISSTDDQIVYRWLLPP